MRYTGLVHTRRAIVALTTPFVIFNAVSLVARFDWSRPGRMAGLVVLTILPLLFLSRCLRFLRQREIEHPYPTPEMSFIFGLSISTPLAMAGIAMIILNS